MEDVAYGATGMDNKAHELGAVLRHIIRSLDQVRCTLDDTSIAEAEPSKIQDKECSSKGTRKIRITGKSND